MRKGGSVIVVWSAVLVIAGLAILFTILYSDMTILFSGLLTAFTALLVYYNRQLHNAQEEVYSLQKRFNAWMKETTEKREDPVLILHGVSKWHHGRDVGQLEFHAANPGTVLISITGVEMEDEAIGVPRAQRVDWVSRFPLLSASMSDGPHRHQGFPVPVFAGGLTFVTAHFRFTDDKHIRALGSVKQPWFRLTYQVGGSTEEKHTRALSQAS